MQMVTWNTPEWRLRNGVGDKSEVPGSGSYVAMLVRCYDEESEAYPRYGGRGIKVCNRWIASFANFIADMGTRPGVGYSLDRIDNDGDYTPENCRWATAKEQQRNRRDNHLLTAFGETKPLAAWVEDARCAVSRDVLKDRIKRGWGEEKAMTTPAAKYVRRVPVNEGAETRTT